MNFASACGKPLVHEQLNFAQRKQELSSSRDARYARMLSSFAYGAIDQAIQSNAQLAGVATAHVNPAYTSVIGRVKWAKPLGISVHQAAAWRLPGAAWDTESQRLVVRQCRTARATTSNSSYLQGIA